MTQCKKDVLRRAKDRNQYQRFHRGKNTYEPLPGFFAQKEEWDALDKDERYLAKILALAVVFPNWIFCGVSAAAIYGASVDKDHQNEIHVCSSKDGKRGKRLRLPVVERFLADYQKILNTQTTIPPTFDTAAIRTTYQPITQSIGRANGVLVTSPLRTMFDVMRDAGFEQGLGMCDSIARTMGIARLTPKHFARLNDITKGAWQRERVLAMLAFVDGRSENGGESLARAHMIMGGLEVPELQVNMDVEEYRGPGPREGTARYQIRRFRVDYMWTVPDSVGGMRRIAGELDGEEKYAKGMTTVNKERRRDALLTASGVQVVHFSHADGCQGSGGSMVRRLYQAGVRMVDDAERERRARMLGEV